MEDCKNCVEGLVHQGESIKTTCTVCNGTGKVGELSEVSSETPMDETVVETTEEVVEAPVTEETTTEEVVA